MGAATILHNQFDNNTYLYYNSCMQYEWKVNKRRINLAKHGIDFTVIRSFNWDTAIEIVDDRTDYGETRINAISFLRERLVVLAYTMREKIIRIITLRKATKTEERFYHDYR